MKYQRSGFTLVEVLLASATLVVFMSVAAVIVQTGIKSVGYARLRSEATRLALEKVEIARNLAYEDVGVVGGIPAGPIEPIYIEEFNGVTFKVATSVRYIDDEFDGLAPSDLLPVDYKRIKVAVTWEGLLASKAPVELMTDITPRGVETADNQGTLSILVFNSQGEPVSGANVHIQASVSPEIDMNVLTDSFGMVLIPGAPICDSCYKIEVTKSGYTTDRTHGIDEVANPVKPHVSVLEGLVSSISFSIDSVSSITVRVTRDRTSGYAPFVGAKFMIRGTKQVGTTEDDEPVYKVEQAMISNTGGLVTLNNLEWDNYTIYITDTSSVDYAGSWPLNPVAVLPGSNTTVAMVIKTASENSLLLQFLDELNQPVSAVTAELSQNGIIEATMSAGVAPNGDQSQAFFSDLDGGMYNVLIQGSAYATASGTININGDVMEKYQLAPAPTEP